MGLNINLSRVFFVLVGFCIMLQGVEVSAITLDCSAENSKAYEHCTSQARGSFVNSPYVTAKAIREAGSASVLKISSDFDKNVDEQRSSSSADLSYFDKTLPINALVLGIFQASAVTRKKSNLITAQETNTYSMLLVGIAMIGFGVRRQLIR